MLEPVDAVSDLRCLGSEGRPVRDRGLAISVEAYVRGRAVPDVAACGRQRRAGSVSMRPLSTTEQRAMRASLQATRAHTRFVSPVEAIARASLVRRTGDHHIIDARGLFEARARARRMAAVDSAAARYESGALHPHDRPGALVPFGTAPLRLCGDGLTLWYPVSLAALAGRLREPAVSIGGRGLVGVCIGRYYRLEPSRYLPPVSDEGLIELHLVALVRGAHGLRLHPLNRLVDPSFLGASLRFLSYRRPRELACIEIERGQIWSVAARWRGGNDQLELRVRAAHWLNLLGLGHVLGSLLRRLQLFLPVGGGLPRLLDDSAARFEIGEALTVRLPERLHQGLIEPARVARPSLVTIIHEMYPIILKT